MTHQISKLEEGTYEIEIDFSDEDIELQATTTVLGDEASARRYVRTFAKDVRRNNRALFPPPPQPDQEDIEPLTDEV